MGHYNGMKKYWSGMAEYTKEKFWSFCWKVFGWRVAVVDDDDDLKERMSCWDSNNMVQLPEMLWEVLTRVEETRCLWPARKDVLDCGGVCRSWRRTTMEIANRSLQLSGNLTFPISLKQPGSPGTLTRCLIYRDNYTQTFILCINDFKVGIIRWITPLFHFLSAPFHDQRKFLLAAKRVAHDTCTEYIISLDRDDISKKSSSYVGMLRSNFFGTKFKLYDAHPPIPNAAKRFPWSILWKIRGRNHAVASISYELSALGNRGPRQMRCEINTMPADSYSLPRIFKLKDVKLVLKEKMSRWQSKFWCSCLNFIGRATFASVKELDLVTCLDDEAEAKKEHESIILQFYKVSMFHIMEYQYPLSAFQAFAICLSSFDIKVA